MTSAHKTVVELRASVHSPPARQLKSVRLEAATTALLMLESVQQGCNETIRPRCVATVPAAKRVLTAARPRNGPVPVDAISAESLFIEQYVVHPFTPGSRIARATTLSRVDPIELNAVV